MCGGSTIIKSYCMHVRDLPLRKNPIRTDLIHKLASHSTISHYNPPLCYCCNHARWKYVYGSYTNIEPCLLSDITYRSHTRTVQFHDYLVLGLLSFLISTFLKFTAWEWQINPLSKKELPSINAFAQTCLRKGLWKLLRERAYLHTYELLFFFSHPIAVPGTILCSTI